MTEHLGFLNEIPYIKNNLLYKFLNDEYLMKLVADSYDVETPAMNLRFKQIYPWEYTVGTTQEQKAFITFEMSADAMPLSGRSTHKEVKYVNLYVYAFCHEGIMLVDDLRAEALELPTDARGSRIDLMTARIDELINGSVFSNWGRFEFQEQAILTPVATDFHGKCNVYRAEMANQYGDKMYEHALNPFEVNLNAQAPYNN